MEKTSLFGAVDLGSDQFVVLVARRVGSTYEIAGLGSAAAAGYTAGRITDLNSATKALQGAIHQADLMAGEKAELGVVAGITSRHLMGASKQAHVKIQGAAVSEADIELAMDTLQAFPIPQDYEILHILEQEYSIDGHGGIYSPLGMTGSLLEAKAYIVSNRASDLTNLRSCVTQAGVSLRRSMSSALASANVITTVDERELGVITLDWGATSCDVAVFQNGVIRQLRNIELGGELIDRDIAKMMHISLQDAKKVKNKIGSAVQVQVDDEASIKVKATSGELTAIEPHVLSMIIEARVEDMLRKLAHELGDWLEKDKLSAGAVLTGGMACLPGILELSNDVLGIPVRIGSPSYVGPHSDEITGPRYSAALGLLELWKDQHYTDHQPVSSSKLLGWFKNLFGDRALAAPTSTL